MEAWEIFQTTWETRRGSATMGIRIGHEEGGSTEVLVYTDYGRSQGGGGASCSAEAFLAGRFWDLILLDHGEETLDHVIATVQALRAPRPEGVDADAEEATWRRSLFETSFAARQESKQQFLHGVKRSWRVSRRERTHRVHIENETLILMWSNGPQPTDNYGYSTTLEGFLRGEGQSLVKNGPGGAVLTEVVASAEHILCAAGKGRRKRP